MQVSRCWVKLFEGLHIILEVDNKLKGRHPVGTNPNEIFNLCKMVIFIFFLFFILVWTVASKQFGNLTFGFDRNLSVWDIVGFWTSRVYCFQRVFRSRTKQFINGCRRTKNDFTRLMRFLKREFDTGLFISKISATAKLLILCCALTQLQTLNELTSQFR
jgi:hypothetical protein